MLRVLRWLPSRVLSLIMIGTQKAAQSDEESQEGDFMMLLLRDKELTVTYGN